MTIRANVAANYFGQIYAALMGFAFVPICIKYLGTESYGLVSVFAILQSSAALLDMGMKATLAREMARYSSGARDLQSVKDLLRSTEILTASVATLAGLAICMGSHRLAVHWLAAERLSRTDIAHALTGMGLICALRFIENVYVGTIIGLQRQVAQAVVSCSMVTARAVGSIVVLALIAPTLDAFFSWQVLVSIISIPVYATLAYRSLPSGPRTGTFSWSALSSIWRFSGGLTAAALLTLLLTQLDKLLLSVYLPLKEFSYYAVASTLSSALYMLSLPISAAFYPSFTELFTRGDLERLRLAYHKAAQLLATIMGGAAIVLLVFPETALSTWTGDADITTHAAPLLRILALGTLLNGFIGIPYQLQLAAGWTSLSIKLNVAAIGILAPVLLYIVPRSGAMGAAWVWVLLNVGYLLIYIYFLHRRLLPSEKWRWYGQDVLIPTLAAALAAVGCRVISFTPTSKGSAIGLLCLVFLTVVLAGSLVCQSIRSQVRAVAYAALRRAR